jgi:hypothetical protein
MRTGVILIVTLGLMSFYWSEAVKHVYQRDEMHVEYSKEHGMLNHKYTSYWPNGKVKAEGAMKANMRFGTWNVYDSTGKLVMARDYETGYAWTQLYPIEFVPTTSKGWFGDRFSVFINIKPDSVIQSARIWRFIYADPNSPVFHNNALLDTLIAMRDRGALQLGLDDEMRVLATREEFHANLDKCNPQHHVIGYRLKEDWYYDAKKKMGIFGVIAICPVLYAKNERDSIDLGWFSYDATLRNKMGTMFFAPRYSYGYPVGVEQTFFLRCFASEVYKTSNVKNYTIAQQFADPKERYLEQQRMEIQPIEWEHDQWLQVFK